MDISAGTESRRAASGALAAAWSPPSEDDVVSFEPAAATPSEPTLSSAALAELDRRLREAAARNESTHAELLELLLQFDEARGWRTTGAKHCAAWMSSELGICAGLAWEKLRVARVLRVRPLLARLYRCGRLGWSKVRALARVVDEHNETALCAMALDATAAEVARECEALRTRRAPADVDDEIAADRRRFLGRHGSWNERVDGSVAFRFVLPPDMAANAIGALQAMEDLLYRSDGAPDADPAAASTEAASERGPDGVLDETDGEAAGPAFAAEVAEAIARPSPAQRRADAFVMLAEQGLAGDERDVTSADRYQVNVTADAELAEEPAPATHADIAPDAPAARDGDTVVAEATEDRVPLPLPARLMLQGTGSITASGVRRMLCDGTLVTTITDAGEPISIGRKSRVWPEPMRRAAIARDEGCRFPGCTQTRWLDVHHIVPWTDGGETSLRNAICLCRHHHRLIHDGGWVIERDVHGTELSAGWALLEGGSARTLAIARRAGMHPVRYRFRCATAAEATAAGAASARSIGAIGSTSDASHESCCTGRSASMSHSTRVGWERPSSRCDAAALLVR